MSDYQEGYADGLAGAGMQTRTLSGGDDGLRHDGNHYSEGMKYLGGFIAGSRDRREMLRREELAAGGRVFDEVGA